MDELILRKMVKKFVNEYIQKRLDVLVEMAFDRKVFIDKAENVMFPTIKHILLLCYCALYDKQNINIRHWRGEILTFCEPLAVLILKNVSKTKHEQVKRKALYNLWIDGWEITTDRMIEGKWGVICQQENLNFEITQDMKDMYRNVINNIIELISKSDVTGLFKYIETI